MTNPIQLLVNLPFDGFYESKYSEGIDHEESSWCEYHATGEDSDADYEPFHPEHLRLTESELADCLFDSTDYSAAYAVIARDYVDAFDVATGELLGLSVKATRQRYNFETKTYSTETYNRPSVRMTFESMDSPREYNFTTDRVYAMVPLGVMQYMFRLSVRENHSTLTSTIKSRFTSYDGFLSGYSNELATWLEKPLQEWDHNELGTLLIAALELSRDASDHSTNDESLSWQVYEKVSDSEGFYDAWSGAVDWTKFEAKRDELRAEKLAEWADENPDLAGELALQTPRCKDTPDMFADR